MLKKPYMFLMNREVNNYYLLKTQEEPFLAIEAVVPYKRWFRKDGEFTQSLILLPLNSAVLTVFIEAIKLEPTGTKSAEFGIEDEIIYPILNIKPIRRRLNGLNKEEAGKSRFNYNVGVNNPTIKSLMDEGHELLTVEIMGSFSRRIWLVKSDMYGTITITEALTVGKPKTAKVGYVNTYRFDKEIIASTIIKMEKERM